MKTLSKIWMAAALITIIFNSTVWPCSMGPLKSRDDWNPKKHYKNCFAVRLVEVEDEGEDDWTLWLWTTKKCKEPAKKHKSAIKWTKGHGYNFTFKFTVETGIAEFDFEQLPTMTYYFPEYQGRGMDEIHIVANSFYRAQPFYWTYCVIGNLKVNDDHYDFVDIDGSGIYTYATISGLNCEDFVLTGKLYCYWLEKLEDTFPQALFRFGEPCGGGEEPPQDPEIDLSGDCIIDFADFAALTANWLGNCQEPNFCGGSDFNNDNTVDSNDLLMLAGKWLDRKYAGGCGTEEAPYLIYNAEQLNTIGLVPEDWSAHFKVMADIDLGGHTGNSFNTIGDANTPFTGVFDGDNWQISYFTQGDGDQNSVGLFRYVDDPNAVIKNIRLFLPTVITKGPHYAGALVGKLQNGLVYNCTAVEGEVIGYGGHALTTGSDFIGGLVGYNGGSVIQCSASCDVSGYDMAGGLVGLNEGTVENSFAMGSTISGHDYIGGLVGKNNMGTISNSFARKSVFAHDWVGGLVGESIDGLIDNCYSTGHVTENSDFRGGLIGATNAEDVNDFNDSFWDIDTGGTLNNNLVGTSLTTTDMQLEGTFTDAGWDFNTPVWMIYETFDYPLLQWSVVPYPSPMAWELPPEPNSAYAITMTARTVVPYDFNSVIEYSFENLTDANHNSGWQTNPVYMDVNLVPRTKYTYRVNARDLTPAMTETGFSIEASTVTPPDSTSPEPAIMTWAVIPHAISIDSIAMTATTATDEVDVEYRFINLSTTDDHDSGWQDDPNFTDTGLDDLKSYTYKVQARDKSLSQNENLWSISKTATTRDGTPPEPCEPGWEIEPTAVGPGTISMRAAEAYDMSGVEYYFHNVTDPCHDSGWQLDPNFIDTGLIELTTYTYQVKTRDRSINNNENGYSAPISQTTLADMTAPEPNPMTWASDPNATGPFSIIMTATDALDVRGVMYYFHNVTDPNHDSGWQESRTYEDTGLTELTTYSYQVKTKDLSVNQNESFYSDEASDTTLADTDAPDPDPMTWASEPNATSAFSVIMTAATAYDQSGVEYYFTNITDPTHDSGWQSSPTFEDTGLSELLIYSYMVKARDKAAAHNTTDDSDPASASTMADSVKPDPDPMTWASEPDAISPASITMTATTATDQSGVRYYFHNITDPNHDSGWQESSTYVDTGLIDETLYSYQVKAQDYSSNHNTTDYSQSASATTLEDNTPPEPNVMTWQSVPAATSSDSIEMTATVAGDLSEPVEYYFENVTDSNHDSGWQTSAFYKDTGLTDGTIYTYRVKAKDASKNHNETAFSSEESAQTQYAVPPTEEQWTFNCIGQWDGRIYDGNEPNAIAGDSDTASLRIGDYINGEQYHSIVSFDTSFLPDDCNITSVTLQLTRGQKPTEGQDPFVIFGDCIIDIAGGYFGSSVEIETEDFNNSACASAVARFTADPGLNLPMTSDNFNPDGRACINTNGITQLRFYIENSTNGDGNRDYLGFYSAEYEDPEYRPKLTIVYNTRAPLIEFDSIAAEDGRVCDINGTEVGYAGNAEDFDDFALRLGDYSGEDVNGPAGYRNIVSFDTSSLPDNCTILTANLLITRGADVGENPFDWAGDCLVDIASPYFGDSNNLEPIDWHVTADAEAVAVFYQDPGEEKTMLSGGFNYDGKININRTGKTQLRFYFTDTTSFNSATDCLGIYSGESAILSKQPKLLIRYAN